MKCKRALPFRTHWNLHTDSEKVKRQKWRRINSKSEYMVLKCIFGWLVAKWMFEGSKVVFCQVMFTMIMMKMYATKFTVQLMFHETNVNAFAERTIIHTIFHSSICLASSFLNKMCACVCCCRCFTPNPKFHFRNKMKKAEAEENLAVRSHRRRHVCFHYKYMFWGKKSLLLLAVPR